MYPEYAPAETAMSLEGHDEPDSRLHGKRLILARAACLAAGILSFGVFVISVPATYEAILSQFCAGPLCNLPSQVSVQFVQQLQALGLSIPAYAIYYVMLDVIFVCTYFVVAIMLFWRRSDDWMALFAAFFLMSFALTFSSDTLEATPYWVFQFVIFLGAVSIVVFFYLFPTGRFVPRWTRWLSIAAIFYWGLKYFLPPFPFNPYTNIIFTNSAFFLFVGAMIVAQVYRYLRVSNGVQRQQTKWVVFGVSIGIGGYLLFALLFVLFFPSASQSPLAGILLNTVDHLLLLLIPISIAFAILRSRLWDIDIIINRTLVYGLLTGTLALIYVSLVIGLQYLLRLVSVQASSLVLVGSTLMIAAIFQPLRRRLQRTINHLMYGERNDPYAVLTRLGLRLEATLAPDAVLPTIVETVAQTLKLAYVAITLTTDERRPIPDQASPLADTFVTVASYGSPTAHPLRLPLVYQTETLGYLLIGPRPGETLTSANQRLLTDLARQIGISAHSVQLTTELQQARESLVLAREEERRRLRRDLHDGLGPQLASQALTLTTARKLRLPIFAAWSTPCAHLPWTTWDWSLPYANKRPSMAAVVW